MKMKWKLSALALGTAISFASFNVAAEVKTADISVIGTIAPASCEPTLSNGAVVNYGSINSASLTAVAPALNQLGTKKIALTISCTGQTLVAVKTTDNKASSLVTLSETAYIADAGAAGTNVVGSMYAYGLGNTETGGVKIGAWAMAVDVSRVDATDGADVSFDTDVLTTRDAAPSTATWTKASGGFMYPMSGAANHISFAQKGSLTPTGIKTVTIPLLVTAAVQPLSVFNNEEVTLSGNATIELVYL